MRGERRRCASPLPWNKPETHMWCNRKLQDNRRASSIPLTKIQRMSNGFTASNTQDGSDPSETVSNQSTIPRKPPGLKLGVISPASQSSGSCPHDTCLHKGVRNYYLTATLLDAQFTFASWERTANKTPNTPKHITTQGHECLRNAWHSLVTRFDTHWP